MENEGNVTGTVFNIQHYCIHDGLGIRTNVFVKGCPIHCAWCANPESQNSEPQLMYLADKCTGCGACIAACPQNAVARKADQPALVEADRSICRACGVCVNACKNDARSISGKTMSVNEAFAEVEEDRLFYGKGGGLTVTGGEPLAHPDFTTALLKKTRESGISTAIETCGAVSWPIMQKALPYVDMVLYDIKQMDSNLHKQYTGVRSEGILENLRRISNETSCDIIVRCPIIPPCNNSPEHLHALGSFLKENAIRVREVNLLPYHNLGEGKRVQLETDIEPFSSHTPSEQEMESLREIVRSYGFTCK